MPTLYWLTRDKDIRTALSVPYRLLEEVSSFSTGVLDVGNNIHAENVADNLQKL